MINAKAFHSDLESSSGHVNASQHSVNQDQRSTPPVLDSEVVLQGHSTVVIAHRGVYYRLQATRQGKLILTK